MHVLYKSALRRQVVILVDTASTVRDECNFQLCYHSVNLNNVNIIAVDYLHWIMSGCQKKAAQTPRKYILLRPPAWWPYYCTAVVKRQDQEMDSMTRLFV